MLTAVISSDPESGGYQGTLINDEELVPETLHTLTWNADRGQLEFSRTGHDFWEWYRCTVVEGVLVGRYSHDENSPEQPANPTLFRFHITGWNSTFLDSDIVPRSYDLIINEDKDHRARLRIDRLPIGQFVGQLKVYTGARVRSLSTT